MHAEMTTTLMNSCHNDVLIQPAAEARSCFSDFSLVDVLRRSY